MDEQTAQPTEVLQTVCSNCGGKLSYLPGTTSLKCEYCGTLNDIKPIDAVIEELDLEEYLEGHIKTAATMEVVTVKCNACSATTTFNKGQTAGSCAFCGNNLVVEGASKQTIIKPKSLLPFKIDKGNALELYGKWLKGLWFAPNGLTKYARQEEKLNGVYMPFWTYDADTDTYYVGQKGVDYTVQVERQVQRDGKWVTETVTETRTNWYPAAGNVNVDFDDVLVVGSRSLPQSYQDTLEPWDLNNLTPFDERYISGFKAESYQVDVKEGWSIAQGKMRPMIENAICRDIGGDHQRIITQNTSYSDMTFKHILLPIWISSYRYQDKIYRFMINARTGEVTGERPWSWIKITLAILLAIAIAVAIYFVAVSNKGGDTSYLWQMKMGIG